MPAEVEQQTLQMMEKFTRDLIKLIEQKMAQRDHEAKIRQNEVLKNNNTIRHGITVSMDGSNIAPTIYIDEMYEEFIREEVTMDDIADRVCDIAIMNKPKVGFDIDSINADMAMDNLYLKLVNAELNPDLVENCATLKMNDLVGFPYLKVSDGPEGMASIVVRRDMQARMLQMTDSEVLAIARENTIKQPFRVQGMSEVMREMMGGDLPEEMLADLIPEGPEMMYVVSSESKINGATALLSDETMEKIKDKIGEDSFYIIPSSIHELIVVPGSGVEDPAYLQDMCQSVNGSEVSPEEVLSNNIYRYDGQTQEIKICNNLDDLKQQMKAPEPRMATPTQKMGGM